MVPVPGFVQVTNSTCTNPTICELFCAGHAFLSDGRVLVAGGHNEALGDLNGITQASMFDGTTWQATGSMHDPRWYPTLVTLANGEVVAISGAMSPGVLSTIPERYNGSTWTQLTGVNVTIPAYARAFVEPKVGNLFIADGNVHNLDPNGAGSWSAGPAPRMEIEAMARLSCSTARCSSSAVAEKSPAPAICPGKRPRSSISRLRPRPGLPQDPWRSGGVNTTRPSCPMAASW